MRRPLTGRSGEQNENRGTEFLGTEPLQCAHGNFTGIETANIHSAFELPSICKTVTVPVKAACRLNLAFTYRVPFSAETCQARGSQLPQECAGERSPGENTAGFCALPPQSSNTRLEHARPRKREPPWAAGHWGHSSEEGILPTVLADWMKLVSPLQRS